MSTAKVNGKTIYIGANTSAVANALKDVEARAQKSKSELKLLEKALKLDPSNVELLNEKQKTLSDSIKTARERLQQLEQASEKVKAEYEGGEIDKGQYLKFKTAVLESQNELKKLTEQAKKNDDAIENASEAAAEGAKNTEDLGDESQETSKELEKTADKANKTSKKFDLMGASAKTAKAAVKGVTSVLKASAAVFTTYVAGASAVAIASVNVGKEFEKANSQLAATMGTTTDQITDLTQKAKELGEKTSFSATEAALGLNILAQAGLNSEEQIASIATVLDLAAAGTLSLEDSASYVTGTIKGFGDEMANAQYYADLIAKGATLANTNVQGLGEALGKASATAHSYGETADSVTLSLLKLANQNVTGETAATMLNRAMADLYTPTDNAKMALDELGIACYDANGETRDFNTVVAELNGKLSTMTDEQANAYKNTIFTVNGLNAFNKMCATSAEQSDEFAKGLSTASDEMGSAAQQAETMLDNLEGQTTLMKSAAEGLGITIYEEMQEPLKNLVKEGTGYISQLNEVLKEDGLLGAVRFAGDTFAEIATKAAESAPDMINASVEFIQSFVTGIKNDSAELKVAAKNIVSALVSGIVTLLPNEVQKPVRTAVKEIQKSFESGGLKKAINNVSSVIKNLGKVTIKITKTVLPPFTKAINLIAEDLEVIVPLISGTVVALKSWKIIGVITTLLQAHTIALTTEAVAENSVAIAAGTATAAYSAKSIVIGTLTGKIGLATAAQYLWNAAMNANPVGLITTGIVALGGAITALLLLQENEISNSDILVDKAEERKKAVDEEKKSYDDLKVAKKEETDAELSEIDRVKTLKDELLNLAGANGEVKESNKSRVDFILNELNGALGTEYELTDNQISKYNELKESIDEVIKAKQAEVLLEGGREVYSEALNNITEAKEEERQATYDLAEAEAELQQYLTDERLAQMPEATEKQIKAWESWGNFSVSNAKQNIETLKENLQNASDNVQTYTDDINNYEKALVAAEENNWNEVSRLLKEKDNTFITSKDNTAKTAEEEKQILGQQYADSLVDLSNYVSKYGDSTDEFHKKEIRRLVQQAWDSKVEAEKVGASIVDGTIVGLNGKELELKETVENLYNKIPVWAKFILDIHSPSRVMRKIFGYVGDGAILGLRDSTQALIDESKNMSRSVIGAIESQLDNSNLVLNPQIELDAKKLKNSTMAFKASIFKHIKDNDLTTPLQAILQVSSLGKSKLINALEIANEVPDFSSVSSNITGNAVTANNGVVLNLNIENFSNNSGQDIKKLAKMLSDEIEKNQNQTNLEINRRLVMW